MNGFCEEINNNKYLTLLSTYESKEIIKKYEGLWSKMRGLIRSITNNLIDYDEKYMKIKIDSDDLPVNITIEFHNATIVVRSVFYTINRYHPQIFLAECLYKL